MKANDFINAILKMLGISEKNYSSNFFHLPRIYCKDGFNISIQVNDGNYCGSENGYRQFGSEWKLVEWGFPSQPIDHKLYMSECETDEETTNSVGSVETEQIDALLESHGGIDILTTLSNAHEWMMGAVRYQQMICGKSVLG